MSIDLATLIEQDIGQPMRRGNWLFWRCPFHADQQPSLGVRGGRYYCFGCGATGDAVNWLSEYRNLPMHAALKLVKGEMQDWRKATKTTARAPIKADAEPDEAWQASAAIWADECVQRIWSSEGRRALEYLRKQRGLTDTVIERFCLGYWPGGNVPGIGVEVRRGITIPNFRHGHLFSVKIRHGEGRPKYSHLRGGFQRLFVASPIAIGSYLVVCEGEFDALVLGQAVGDALAIATMGSCSTLPGAHDQALIGLADLVIVAYDNDESGRAGAHNLAGVLGQGCRLADLPQYKDINEAYLGGFDFWAWLRPYLQPVQGTFEWAARVGALVREVNDGQTFAGLT